jgi:hypothetical protein
MTRIVAVVENQTRWFSQLKVLIWAHKCLKKKLDESTGIKFPAIETIEGYLQVLVLAYKCNLGSQFTNSNICTVLPAITFLIDSYSKIEIDGQVRMLCFRLVHFLNEKFKFELSSPIYKVISNFRYFLIIAVF